MKDEEGAGTAPARDESESVGGIFLSIVVPIFDEEESLHPLHAEISAVLDEIEGRSEIIYVDDGSRDRSSLILRSLCMKDPRVRVIHFRRNFGQTPALQAGFDHARGAVVVTLDGDLQNDPRDIPRLVAALDQGYDIAAGWRKNRRDKFLSRRIPSMIANRMMAHLSGVNIHDSGCTLKAFRSGVVKNLSLYSDLHRFIPAMASASGARVCELVVNHRQRFHGASKYGILRTIRVIFDLMTVKMLIQFASRPLHWFALLSLPFLLLAGFFFIGGMVRITTMEIASEFTITFPSIGILFTILAVQLVLLGLLGELVIKTSGLHRRRILNTIVSEVR